MKKSEIPESFDSKEIDPPNEETLDAFEEAIIELAPLRPSTKITCENFRNSFGRVELQVTQYSPEVVINGARAEIKLFFHVKGGKYGDEEEIDTYTLYDDPKRGKWIEKFEQVVSNREEAIRDQEHRELQELDPEEDRRVNAEIQGEEKKKMEELRRLERKGIPFVSDKKLQELTIYLRQFIKEAQAEKSGKESGF
jgi:hypothetical protein